MNTLYAFKRAVDGLLKAPRTAGTTKERRNKKRELRTAHTRHAGPATIPSSVAPSLVHVRRPGSPCAVGSRPDFWRDEWLSPYKSISKDILVRNARFLCEVETSWCKTFCPPLRNVTVWRFQSSKIFACQGHPLARRACQSRSQRIGSPSACNIFELVLRHGTLGPGQVGTLISGLRRYVLLAKSCGADLEDHQSVFCTLWRVHRSWSLAILGRVQNTSISRDRIECGSIRLAPECPRTILFDVPFVSLFVAPSGSQATSIGAT